MAYHIDEENSEIIFEVNGEKVALKLKGSSGGGGGEPSVYLIKKNDSTAPSDNNTFSALRILAEILENNEELKNLFLSRQKDDRTDHSLEIGKNLTVEGLTKALGGIEVTGNLSLNSKITNDIIRRCDIPRAVSTDANIYSALMTDERINEELKDIEGKYIRKDQPDSTPYPVDFMGGLSINSKRIGDIIRYYDNPRAVSTDANIYSALMTDERINEELKDIDDRYLRKDKEDFAHKHITFEEGITVYDLAKLMNLDVKNLATIAKAVVSILRSSKFVDGFSGEGYQIWQDIASGDWNLTIDRITVRKVMTIYELVVQKIRSVGGMVVVSAANGKVKSVEKIGSMYLFTFEDANQFQPDDLMRCQVFSSSGLKYYWVKVASVRGESVLVPVSEFDGVTPAEGDECVLMGNSANKRRQSLIIISATEDGQPRFDCMNGVKSKSFEGCLKVRVGNLDGISDSRFPANMQPSGHGLYGNNCFLTGIFVLSNGKDVMTMFSIMEGMIKAEISSVRNEVNSKDNYLSNASFADNLSGWKGSNNIHVFSVSNRLLYFNNNFYANKEAFANIVEHNSKNVLRLKKSNITQLNGDFYKHPEFDKYVQVDVEGNPILDADGNPVKLFRPRMFYVSFQCMVTRPGTLHVYFKGENKEGFEEYKPINHTEDLQVSDTFKTIEIAGKWNGTGDFFLSFSGDSYIYSLAIADNPLADMEEKFTMRFEMTERKIQANLDEIKRTGTKLEEYHSQFLLTARNLELKFTEDLSNSETNITNAYKSWVEITARDLRVGFIADINNAESRITEAYTSAIKLSAKGLETKFTADITDMETGITSAYKSLVELTARHLQAEFTEDITDLRTGITSAYKGEIEASARGLRADFNSSISDLNGKLTTHTGSFHVTATKIEGMVTATDNISNKIASAGWITTSDGNKLWATTTQYNDLNQVVSTHAGSFHVTSDKIEGIMSDITEQGTNYSKLTQTVNGVVTEVKNARGDSTTLAVEIGRIEGRIGSMEGDLSIFEQTAERIEASVIASDGRLATLQITADGIDQKVTDANGTLSSLNVRADRIEQKISGAEGDVTSINVRLGRVETVAGYFNADGTLKEGAGWVTTANANTLFVKRDGIISSINQTAESVSIDASKINLNGVVTANGYFKIKLDGSIEAVDAIMNNVTVNNMTLKGNITGVNATLTNITVAKGAKIGRFRVLDNYLSLDDPQEGTIISIGSSVLPATSATKSNIYIRDTDAAFEKKLIVINSTPPNSQYFDDPRSYNKAIDIESGTFRVSPGNLIDTPGFLVAGRVGEGCQVQYQYGRKGRGNLNSTYAFAVSRSSDCLYTITHNLGHTNYTLSVTPWRSWYEWNKVHAIILDIQANDFKIVFVDSGSGNTWELSGFCFEIYGENTN